PLSIGMFPHVYQHWLTAKSAKSFKPLLVLHPICTMLVWLPCVLIGVWATAAALPDGTAIISPGSPVNGELGMMVRALTTPLLGGLLGAGILAAVMSSLDSQLLAIGSMVTNDIAVDLLGRARLGDRQKVRLGRLVVIGVAAAAYWCSLAEPRSVFTLGVWCFSGYSALFPLVLAAIYWRRATAAGAIAAVLATVAVGLALFREGSYGSDPGYLFMGMLPVVPMLAASTLALVGVSLATQPPSARTLKKFFRT
ncbi:MAG: hypothetical protein OXD30_04230, partial [Bryobacterales bacterium]|nr:hypothetical protein [Bryobacterales bacterium]